MAFYDYIIASHRVRIFGLDSELSSIGLSGFAPFYDKQEISCKSVESVADVEDVKPPIVEIYFRQQLSYLPEAFDALTSFDLENGIAECLFSASATEYLLEFKGANGGSCHYIYQKDRSVVLSDFSEATNAIDLTMLRFGLWFMVGIAMADKGCSAVHSSVIVYDGRAVMFLGESGTGKSTHTRLWRENISGAELLNDDSPFVSVENGQVQVFGSPWSGKTPCYKNQSCPLHAIVRLSQAPHNKISRLRRITSIGALLPSLPPAFLYDKALEQNLINILSAIVAQVPLYHLECLPDAAAAELSFNTLFENEVQCSK